MASYEIEWKSSAERDLRAIDRQFIAKILQAVESLGDDPFPLRGRKLHGVEHTYRIRVGVYRVIYQVDRQKKLVVVHHVRHRKMGYRT
jgi:mRNA interferase RelE/StbE